MRGICIKIFETTIEPMNVGHDALILLLHGRSKPIDRRAKRSKEINDGIILLVYLFENFGHDRVGVVDATW